MTELSDNEKAAIAGRLWEPGPVECSGTIFGPCPDMSLPENYMRAVEECDFWSGLRSSTGETSWWVRRGDAVGTGTSAMDALAYLYDVEHRTGTLTGTEGSKGR